MATGAAISKHTITAQDDAGNPPVILPLSPYDIACLGRAIPMVWIYSSVLDVEKLVSSLEATLSRYSVLCGRYDATPPSGISMNNKGIVFERAKCPGVVKEYLSHLNPSTDPTFFDITKHVPLLPEKSGMDPDKGEERRGAKRRAERSRSRDASTQCVHNVAPSLPSFLSRDHLLLCDSLRSSQALLKRPWRRLRSRRSKARAGARRSGCSCSTALWTPNRRSCS